MSAFSLNRAPGVLKGKSMRPEIIHGREQECSPSAALSLFQAARACSPSITCTYPRLGTRPDVSFWPKRTFELVAIKSAFDQ